jgi:hypothetical protein
MKKMDRAMLYCVPDRPRVSERPSMLALPMLARSMKEKR